MCAPSLRTAAGCIPCHGVQFWLILDSAIQQSRNKPPCLSKPFSIGGIRPPLADVRPYCTVPGATYTFFWGYVISSPNLWVRSTKNLAHINLSSKYCSQQLLHSTPDPKGAPKKMAAAGKLAIVGHIPAVGQVLRNTQHRHLSSSGPKDPCSNCSPTEPTAVMYNSPAKGISPSTNCSTGRVGQKCYKFSKACTTHQLMKVPNPFITGGGHRSLLYSAEPRHS